MSKLDYFFESHKIPNVHAMKEKNMIRHDKQHSTSKILLLSLTYPRTSSSWAWGCWYVSNVSIIFYCSMLFYYQSWMFYNHFIVILYHFLVLTYWHSAKCQLLFSACFLHSRKSILDGVQMQRNFTEIFLNQKEHNGPWLLLGGAPRRAQHTRARQEAQARPAGLCPPRVPPGPPLCSINTLIFPKL